jgi:hypothetical protein
LSLTVYVGGQLFKLGQDPSKCTAVQNGGLVSGNNGSAICWCIAKLKYVAVWNGELEYLLKN